jgi:hypothetical protein
MLMTFGRKHTESVMDGIWEWARRLGDLWVKEIFSLEGNRKMTFEMRDGGRSKQPWRPWANGVLS